MKHIIPILLLAACVTIEDGDTTIESTSGPTSSGAPSDGSSSGSESDNSGSTSSTGAPTDPNALCHVGVYECDLYISAYTLCIEEALPESVKETSLMALETSCEAWQEAVETEAGREGLVDVCVAAYDAVAESCGW